jgi:hypothetical protein
MPDPSLCRASIGTRLGLSKSSPLSSRADIDVTFSARPQWATTGHVVQRKKIERVQKNAGIVPTMPDALEYCPPLSDPHAPNLNMAASVAIEGEKLASRAQRLHTKQAHFAVASGAANQGFNIRVVVFSIWHGGQYGCGCCAMTSPGR